MRLRRVPGERERERERVRRDARGQKLWAQWPPCHGCIDKGAGGRRVTGERAAGGRRDCGARNRPGNRNVLHHPSTSGRRNKGTPGSRSIDRSIDRFGRSMTHKLGYIYITAAVFFREREREREREGGGKGGSLLRKRREKARPVVVFQTPDRRVA